MKRIYVLINEGGKVEAVAYDYNKINKYMLVHKIVGTLKEITDENRIKLIEINYRDCFVSLISKNKIPIRYSEYKVINKITDELNFDISYTLNTLTRLKDLNITSSQNKHIKKCINDLIDIYQTGVIDILDTEYLETNMKNFSKLSEEIGELERAYREFL